VSVSSRVSRAQPGPVGTLIADGSVLGGQVSGLVAAARAGFFEEIVEQVVEVRIALADGECSDPSLGHRAEALLELIGWVALSISQKPDRVRRYLHQRAAAARAEAYALEAALRAA
jgi:hypothetical protein